MAWIYYRDYFYNGLHGMLLSSLIIDVLVSTNFFRQGLASHPLTSAMFAQMLAGKLDINSGVAIFFFAFIIVTIGSPIVVSAHLVLSFPTVISTGISISIIVATASKATNVLAKPT